MYFKSAPVCPKIATISSPVAAKPQTMKITICDKFRANLRNTKYDKTITANSQIPQNNVPA
jgi:hypothetical protein